jgi:hypothetical protein
MGYESAYGESVLVPMVHILSKVQRAGISVHLVKFRQHSCQLWPFISMLKFVFVFIKPCFES